MHEGSLVVMAMILVGSCMENFFYDELTSQIPIVL